MRIHVVFLASQAFLLAAGAVAAEEGRYPWSGDWYLKIGATGFLGPEYEGSSKRMLQAAPLVSLGKAGSAVRFSSRNDNMSYALLDQGHFRAGAVGKLIFERDEDDSSDLDGLDRPKFGGEVGGFAEVYPTDWMRLRAEIRQGIRSHHGVVADVAADAFADLGDTVRISAGPRLTAASSDYFDAYYGVNAAESVASGLGTYDPGGGIHSAGLGAEINWMATEKLETGVYAEYRRLMGAAAGSSLVRERGSRDQFLVGVTATYRFDFTLP